MSDSWVCLGGLPDIRDRQRSFCTCGRGKNVVRECKGEFEHGLSDGQVICMPIISDPRRGCCIVLPVFIFFFFFCHFCPGHISGTVTRRDSKLSVLLGPAV